jgi:hypothetical protein
MGLLRSFLFGVMAALAVIACDLTAKAQVGAGFSGTPSVPPGTYFTNSQASSAVSLTSTTAANVAALTLPAGDWDCSGVVVDAPAGGTTTSLMTASISTTTATQNTTQFSQSGAAVSAGVISAIAVPVTRIQSTGAQNVFLVATSTFAVSTKTAGGTLQCRSAGGFR